MVKGLLKKMFGRGSSSHTKQAQIRPSSMPSAEPDILPEAGTPEAIVQNAKAVTGFEFKHCHGSQAFALWKNLRKDSEFYPVIIGSEEAMTYTVERCSSQLETEIIETDPGSFEFPGKFLEKKQKEAAQYYEVEDVTFDLTQSVNDVLGRWTEEPYEAVQDEPTVIRNYKGDFHDTVYIALIPTDDWTKVPALMQFGGWNYCPEDEWHVAAFRHWDKLYSAELVSMTQAIVELRVKHRPQMLRDAVTLAMEQYHYCNDIVDQGVDDPANLAKFLMQNNMWYFWWD